MLGTLELQAPRNPYKRLAEAVLIQAIKDATHDRKNRNVTKAISISCRRDRQNQVINIDKAIYFLLKDSLVFPFWCEVAELRADTVRQCLLIRLTQRNTYRAIRRQFKTQPKQEDD